MRDRVKSEVTHLIGNEFLTVAVSNLGAAIQLIP